MDLEDNFTKMLGRAPSDAERQTLYRTKDALGIKPNDAIWVILMALGYHQTMYEAMPAKITKTASDTLTAFKTAADAEMKASVAATKQDLAAVVIESATTMARNVSAKQKWQWAAGCFTLVCMTFAGFGFFMHRTGNIAGHDLGYAQGYEAAKDEKAAAAWANTPQGQLAYRLAKAGSLEALARCQNNGWHAEKGVCFPSEVPGKGIYGWHIP